MTSSESRQLSSYLQHLPALFQEPEGDAEAGGDGRKFLGLFLLAFEKILTGLGDLAEPGIEELLDGIVDHQGQRRMASIWRYFDPGPGKKDAERAPAGFLDWLAGWVALSLRADWSDD